LHFTCGADSFVLEKWHRNITYSRNGSAWLGMAQQGGAITHEHTNNAPTFAGGKAGRV
jgi:hypothetical protein